MHTPKFAHTSHSFHVELKKRINDYFARTGKPTTGGLRLFSKASFLLIAFIYTYIQLVFFTPSAIWAIMLSVILGVLTASVGFNIMHDGGHGSFSKYAWVNKIAAFTAGILGASYFMWNMKHNVIHHAYTNIDGVDDDIDAKPFLRMAATQKRYKIHKFQHFYFWLFYCLLHLYWTTLSDFKKYFSGKIGEVPLKKMTLKDHIDFWGFKLLYYFLFIVIPIYNVGVIDWLIGFLIFTVVTGFILSIVFQLAHTVEDTQFPVPDITTGKLEDEWAIHQLKTTANFSTKSKIISWYVGGLNFQIEHHLFPKISHIHYPAISKIIKQACQEHGIVYVEYKRMHHAIFSHISFLRQMGKA
ncbi:MAG: fatty acid desaturase family protein [Chitinophagaceae bacterium]